MSGVVPLPKPPVPPPPPSSPPPPIELPIEHRLESPTAIERALGDLGEAAWEERAAELTPAPRGIETDRERVADIAYELGELCERRLVDEARAVKAFGRALASNPSLRANLWAIRRVFYRRGLWPNLIKLIDAESRFAIDDDERADLAIEKAAVLADKLGQQRRPGRPRGRRALGPGVGAGAPGARARRRQSGAPGRAVGPARRSQRPPRAQAGLPARSGAVLDRARRRSRSRARVAGARRRAGRRSRAGRPRAPAPGRAGRRPRGDAARPRRQRRASAGPGRRRRRARPGAVGDQPWPGPRPGRGAAPRGGGDPAPPGPARPRWARAIGRGLPPGGDGGGARRANPPGRPG